MIPIAKFKNSLIQPFDFKSVMMYPLDAFSKNGKNTMIPKKSLLSGFSVGQRGDLSRIDITQVNGLYECGEFTSLPAVWRSVFLSIKYCISKADSSKTHSFVVTFPAFFADWIDVFVSLVRRSETRLSYTNKGYNLPQNCWDKTKNLFKKNIL